MANKGYSKSIRRLLREYSAEAHERELHRELTKLDQSFSEWREGKIGSGELSIRVHEYHQGPSRNLFKQYNDGQDDMNVAYAIVTEILDADEVPPALLESLDQSIAFYEGMKARGDLRLPEQP